MKGRCIGTILAPAPSVLVLRVGGLRGLGKGVNLPCETNVPSLVSITRHVHNFEGTRCYGAQSHEEVGCMGLGLILVSPSAHLKSTP